MIATTHLLSVLDELVESQVLPIDVEFPAALAVHRDVSLAPFSVPYAGHVRNALRGVHELWT